MPISREGHLSQMQSTNTLIHLLPRQQNKTLLWSSRPLNALREDRTQMEIPFLPVGFIILGKEAQD